MSVRTVCDGCDKVLNERQVAIRGERADGMVNGGIYNGEFHWCYECAAVALGSLAGRKGGSK